MLFLQRLTEGVHLCVSCSVYFASFYLPLQRLVGAEGSPIRLGKEARAKEGQGDGRRARVDQTRGEGACVSL